MQGGYDWPSENTKAYCWMHQWHVLKKTVLLLLLLNREQLYIL